MTFHEIPVIQFPEKMEHLLWHCKISQFKLCCNFFTSQLIISFHILHCVQKQKKQCQRNIQWYSYMWQSWFCQFCFLYELITLFLKSLWTIDYSHYFKVFVYRNYVIEKYRMELMQLVPVPLLYLNNTCK